MNYKWLKLANRLNLNVMNDYDKWFTISSINSMRYRLNVSPQMCRQRIAMVRGIWCMSRIRIISLLSTRKFGIVRTRSTFTFFCRFRFAFLSSASRTTHSQLSNVYGALFIIITVMPVNNGQLFWHIRRPWCRETKKNEFIRALDGTRSAAANSFQSNWIEAISYYILYNIGRWKYTHYDAAVSVLALRTFREIEVETVDVADLRAH